MFKAKNEFGAFPKPKGDKSWAWKGDKAHIRTKHMWIARTFGRPEACDNVNCLGRSKFYDWANISGKYKRDRSDYFRLCRSCHKRFDMGIIDIKGIVKSQKYRFSKKEITNIRKQYSSGLKSQTRLANEYNVSPSHISYICSCKYYKI